MKRKAKQKRSIILKVLIFRGLRGYLCLHRLVYRALYGSKETWVRPYAMFMEEVDRVKYPQVRQTYRFEKFEGEVPQG